MGLQDAFKNAAVAAFKAASDLLETVTFKYIEDDSGYDTESGTPSDSINEYTVEMLFLDWSVNEVDGVTVLPTDMKAQIPVENMSVTPNLKCKIEHNSVDLDIKNIKTDPAKAIWTFQLRQS